MKRVERVDILKKLGYLFIGFGAGLIFYQYLTEWMPLVAGVFLLAGFILLMVSKGAKVLKR